MLGNVGKQVSGKRGPGEVQNNGGKQQEQQDSSEDEKHQDHNGKMIQHRQPKLTQEEYEFIARDIMAKPPVSGYLKYNLPLRYASRCDEVRWQWVDNQGRLCYKELIGGGKNSDLEYD